MKNYLLLPLLAFLSISCYSTYPTLQTVKTFNDEIEFKINQVQEGDQISTGNGYIRASRGSKFVFVFMTFTNKTSTKQDLNFDNILLLDVDNKTEYKPEFNMATGPITLMGKIDSSISANGTKSRKIVFLFPENKKPKYLAVNEQLIEIEYK